MIRKSLFLTVILVLVLALTGAAWLEEPGQSYLIMRPDRATLWEWVDDYQNAPKALLNLEIETHLKA